MMSRATIPLAFLLAACGPSSKNTDDVYPRNCGAEGPVDLLDVEPLTVHAVEKAGDYYLIEQRPQDGQVTDWLVDRCGKTARRLPTGPSYGVAGDHVLSCDAKSGAMRIVDPTGDTPPRPLFDAVEGCRIVSVGDGLAAQRKGGGTVWFHPSPANPSVSPVVVTDGAIVTDPQQPCLPGTFVCESSDTFGVDILGVRGELLVPLADGSLLAFSPGSLQSRTLAPGPVFALAVLKGGDLAVVDPEADPTSIVDPKTGESFEFCCWDELSPLVKQRDLLVKGWYGPPLVPEPPKWANFDTYDLRTGARTEVQGRDDWSPFAALSDDALLVDIRLESESQELRYVFLPATGERHPIDLPGDGAWTFPDQDGAYVFVEGADAETVRYLAGPDAAPQLLLEDVTLDFPTRSGRIVFEDAHANDEPTALSVLMPDGRRVDIAHGILNGFGGWLWDDAWPLDQDEVVYLAQHDGIATVRRTVLP